MLETLTNYSRVNGGITYGEMLTKFKQKYPAYAKRIDDYRPSRFMNGITVWFKGGFSLSVAYDENTDKFELLDLTNYTFYEEVIPKK